MTLAIVLHVVSVQCTVGCTGSGSLVGVYSTGSGAALSSVSV